MINLGLCIFQFLNAERQINFVHTRPFYPVPEGLWSNQAAPEKKKHKKNSLAAHFSLQNLVGPIVGKQVIVVESLHLALREDLPPSTKIRSRMTTAWGPPLIGSPGL